MVASERNDVNHETEAEYDRKREIKAFDDTKAGVKGLVDAGITEVPRMFIGPPEDLNASSNSNSEQHEFPVIDLHGIHEDAAQRKETVEKVREASGTWDTEVKKPWCTREPGSRRVVYDSNFDLYSAPASNWRDTLTCAMAPNPPSPEDLPSVCSEILLKYSEEVTKLGYSLFELLSEALGLDPNHLKDMDCAEGLIVLCHYYPACPRPELTLGASKHEDDDFLTVLLQDHVGGLQVLYGNQWIDVSSNTWSSCSQYWGPSTGKLVSNDKFLSARHRVLASRVGPRVSVASFFTTYLRPSTKLHGPIKELLSENDPPKYRETTIKDYSAYFDARDSMELLLCCTTGCNYPYGNDTDLTSSEL
ncbi:unnamed protein product [Coffea canephora]|uniref:Fe2OG dioxygenase domain-containing protein n=1 Tax=Coffea canephora TaxID=49390 RepID=A0A068V4E0_COFCA|nr:unnamed protein product [Coffea canephora]